MSSTSDKPVYILGINAYHGDSSACLLRDGALVAAAEEERFRRVKHWAGFPELAIRYCLDQAGIGADRLDHAALNRDPKANLWKKLAYTARKRPEFGLLLERIKNAKDWAGAEQAFRSCFPQAAERLQFHAIEHHRAHLASAFFASPFDDAVAVSIDGFGDFASAAWGLGDNAGLSVDDKVYFPHSLGIFYQALTQYLGFNHYGDEYKVMGMAPYGEPRFIEPMQDIARLEQDGSFSLNLTYFRHHREKVEYEWDNGAPVVGRLFSADLEAALGPARAADQPLEQHHKDLARSVQLRYEQAMFHLLNRLHQRHGNPRLCLSGGCAMNSVANGKVRRQTPFEQVYIQAAAGDAGGAIGAAWSVWHQQLSRPRCAPMRHAYWGPESSPAEVQTLLQAERERLDAAGCRVETLADEAQLLARTAAAIADGRVVGWFQGRMEWGPRALGNRSILGDPRRADMKDILNLKIKRRESFRPFAPSILRERVDAWFEQDDDVPFMMKVFPIREDKRPQIPAVTHVDGSGRLQTVTEADNPRYYRLIRAFEDLTGVPILLNTSFNENEPVVCRPGEALETFLRTRMDLLVLGDLMVHRTAGDNDPV